MASNITAEAFLKEDIPNSTDKNALTTEASAVHSNQTPTLHHDISEQTTSPANATSTFKALATVSYAERIRASSPSTEHVAPSKSVAAAEEGSRGTGKANASVSADGRPNSVKRSGKNKATSASNHTKGAASRSTTATEAGPAVSAVGHGSDASEGQQQGEGAGIAREDGDQGWQEVTAKSKNHHNSKNGKKDDSSSGTGRSKQHGKKLVSSVTTTPDDALVTEKVPKGKNSSGRKDKEKGDKEPRTQQQPSENSVPIEPTRKQQQQQKEKEGSTSKSLGMKSASWRSGPLTAKHESVQVLSTSESQAEELNAREEAEVPEASNTSDELVDGSTDVPQGSTAVAGNRNDTEHEVPTSPIVPPVNEVKSKPASSSVPAVNIWQLRKEKMKSGSGKQSKNSSSNNTNSKTVFSSLTDAGIASSTTHPVSSHSGKKIGDGNKMEEGQGKRDSTNAPQPLNVTTPSSTGKSTGTGQAAKNTSAESLGRRDTSVPRAGSAGGAHVPSVPSARLADDQLWPDIAASAARNAGSAGIEAKKREKEEDQSSRSAAPNKKEKKKWTPIPPAEMQEALDKAEKARKAASHVAGEGGKQKRRNSAVAGTDDGSQATSKVGVKKSAPGQNKAGGKAGQTSTAGQVSENSSKKGKAASSVTGKQANGTKHHQGDSPEEKGSTAYAAISDSATVSGPVNPTTVENPRTAHRRGSIDVDTIAPQTHQSSSAQLAVTGELESKNENIVPTSSLAEETGSPKRKTPLADRQKGQSSTTNGRQSGPPAALSSNHHPQSRDAGRGGIISGRGGRGSGGKGSRSSNQSSSKYNDNGMDMPLRGQPKPGLLSPSGGGYQTLPYESSMAAAINAPGFVPYGAQSPYHFYHQGYYYGSAAPMGVSSSGSDSGGYDLASNVQQGVQQPLMPYNMASMPQQRPVTEIPGLDPLRYYILGQIEYYFSIHNLCMDQFLKEQMDSHGWVDIPMIASFNRIRQVTTDEALVKEVTQLSHILEVRENKMRLRDNWQVWVFPSARPSIFPEAENSSATRLEELTMHGVRVADLSNETRERIVGDIERDILRSKTAVAPNTQPLVAATDTDISASASVNEAVDDLMAKSTPPTSIASDSSSDKLDIIL